MTDRQRPLIAEDVFFRKLIEYSFSGITLLDRDLRIIYRSPSAERIGGWSDSERKKFSGLDLIHADDRPAVRELLNQVISKPGLPHTITFRSQHQAGNMIWLQCTFTNRLNDPDIQAIVCNFIDISTQQQDRAQIAENERFIQNVTDHLPALIAYWTEELNCLFANQAYLDWFGLSRDAIRSTPKSALFDKDYQTYLPYINRVLNGEPQGFERTFEKADGSRMPTHTQYIPDIRDGRVVGFFSLIYNIADIRRTEAALLEKSAQLEALLENMADGFISLDAGQRYLYVNQKTSQLVGKPSSELIGRRIWDVFPDAVGSATYQAIQTAYQEGRYVCNEDYYPPLDLWQENRVYPAGDGVSIFIRDITERKRDEIRQQLITDISALFGTNGSLEVLLGNTMRLMTAYGGFSLGECWLTGEERHRISLIARYAAEGIEGCFDADPSSHFAKGEGLPGITWQCGQAQFWEEPADEPRFLRGKAAKTAGLHAVHGLPLITDGELIGVIVLGAGSPAKPAPAFRDGLRQVCHHLAAEIRRKQLERELDQVFQFTPDILCIAHIDGYFKKVNPAMCRLLEYTEEELLERPFLELIYPADRHKTAIELERIKDGQPTFYIENRYRTRSGKLRWLAWTTTAASAQGMIYCAARDITEKTELETLLHKATNLARIGGWEVDLQQGTVFWSAMTRLILEVPADYEPELGTGRNFYKPGEGRELIERLLDEAIRLGQSWDVEAKIVTALGNERWVRVIGEPELLDGQCIRLIGSFQDIDALKRAELAARELLQEKNTILESIGDAFFAIDRDWTVTYWNTIAERLFNRPRTEILGNNLLEAFPAWVGSPAYTRYVEVLEHGKAVRFEHQALAFEAWLETSIYPGEHGLAVYIKDISERKKAEQQLRDLNSHLQAQARALSISNAELEQFAYVASHDLQEPLRMVTSFLTQLEQKYKHVVDEKGRRYIHFAVDGAKRMRQLILDLLEFSRAGRQAHQTEPVTVDDLLAEIRALYRQQIDDSSATISANGLPVVRAAKVPLRQVFQNLVSNALKYQAPGTKPEIQISAEELAEEWLFSVKDNGIGIDPEYFEKIFVIFQRLHAREDYPGTGMGLAITKKLIEQQGGRIWLVSAEGQGSTFCFTIPKIHDETDTYITGGG